MCQFRIGGLLGKGTFGKVSFVEHKLFGDKYALKTLHPGTNANDMVARMTILEMMVLLRIQRKPQVNLVSALAMDDSQLELPILLPVAERDFLAVVTDDGWAMKTQLVLLLDAVQGVSHLHKELGVVHMDLKADNVLVYNSPQLHAKVADFGQSREIGERCDYRLGTTGFVPLETLSGPFVALPRQDVFSLAAMLLMVCKAGNSTYNMFAHSLILTAEEKTTLRELKSNNIPTDDFEVEVMRRVLLDETFESRVLVPDMMDDELRSPGVLCDDLRRFLTSAPSDIPDIAMLKTIIRRLMKDVHR